MTPHKLHLIVRNRNDRAATINSAMRLAGENIYCLDAIVSTMLPVVEREAAEFNDYFGEALPPHAEQALEREIRRWRRLQESLALYRDSDPTEEDATRYVAGVRRFLGYQHDLVQLEAEMLESCLVEYYRKEVDSLTMLMRQVPL